ncbi:hypothetical protein [Chloroflexus sp. Y-396-1]|nr:hypothetical protein [Chloroflexus sp. Y-396-1]
MPSITIWAIVVGKDFITERNNRLSVLLGRSQEQNRLSLLMIQ